MKVKPRGVPSMKLRIILEISLFSKAQKGLQEGKNFLVQSGETPHLGSIIKSTYAMQFFV